MRLLILFIAGLLTTIAPAGADTIHIRADFWCPYNCASQSSKPGYAIEIIKAIFENAGHHIDYQRLNWSQSIARTRAGEFTAIIGATRNDAPDFIFPNTPIGLSSISYATLSKNHMNVTSVDDLHGKLLGVIDAYSYNPSVDAYIAAHKNSPNSITFASGDDALDMNIQNLLAGKLDVICDDSNVLFYKSNKNGVFDRLHITRDSGLLSDIYLAFSPKNPKAQEYATLLDDGMKILRESGKLKSILIKYGLSDWQ